jgi:hypothetical protein
MNTQVAVTHRTTETSQAAIADQVSVLGQVGCDQARPAWNLASGQRPSVVVSAESPTDAVHGVQFAHARGTRIAMPDTLRYHSISCACEQCIRVDERIPSISPPVTIAFDADELCGYYEFHKFMDVELRCGFSKGHASKHYDYRHRTVFWMNYDSTNGDCPRSPGWRTPPRCSAPGCINGSWPQRSRSRQSESFLFSGYVRESGRRSAVAGTRAGVGRLAQVDEPGCRCPDFRC